MADKCVSDFENRNYFKEAVCIDANRIYDSCSDKDCLEDIRVYIPLEQQQLLDSARDVRMRNVQVITVYTDLQELPFHKGYYTVDLTFFMDVALEVFGGPGTPTIPVRGISVFNKKCVMYGSEGGVKTFYSDMDRSSSDVYGVRAEPRVAVQVAEPVALEARLCDCCAMRQCCCEDDFERLPRPIRERYGNFELQPRGKCVFASIGLFMIIQLSRNVQIMIPAYDYCIPTKECSYNNSDSPCDLFSQIEFPTEEFFPPRGNEDNGCGCGHR